jgi:hypothetical protein
MSPGSAIADQIDKPSEYAAAGIPHLWRMENADDEDRPLTVFRYRLDPTTRTYVGTGADTGKVVITEPFRLAIDLAGLR